MAEPGDTPYLGSILARLHFWGVVSDMDVPGGVTGTFELADQDGAVTMDALIGPRGPAGENAPIVKMQYQSSIDDPADLPQNLTDDPIDIGKAWWVGNIVYLWDGEHYVQKQMGTQGPPGPLPNITPTVQLLDPDNPSLTSEIIVSGTSANPTWLLKLKAPRGPQGDNATIRDATDYDDSVAPAAGQVIAWNGVDYAPADFNPLATRFYTVPESAFTDFTGLATRQTIGSFIIPPMPFDYVPVVHGHFKANGIELDADPFIIGSEVRIGNATSGQLIAKGAGNMSSWSALFPHASSTGSPNTAITPDNGIGMIPAYSTGTTSTLYVNLVNEGMAGFYSFNKAGAQLSILIVPVSPLKPEDGS